jgi:hypothetical protein
MHMHHLNLLAILVAAISTMVVGFLWYSPLLFAKPWMREMGYDPNDKAKTQEMQKTAGPAYAGSFVASLLSAFTLALILEGLHTADVPHGALHEAEHETFRDEHRLPVGLLSRDGSDSYRLALANCRYGSVPV